MISLTFAPIISQACNCYNITANGITVPESGAAWGCVLQTIQNLLNVGVTLGVVLITIFIAWAGIAYLMAPINAEARQAAKSRLMNAVIGLLIMLGAWLLIDSVMKVIYNSGTFGPWNAILADNNVADNCIAPRSAPVNLPGLNNPTNANGGTPPPVQQTNANPAPTGACGANTHLNCAAAVAWLVNNVHSTNTYLGGCLHDVRQALSAGGVSLSCGAPPPHSEYAGYCNTPLQELHFTFLGASDPSPQPADILVEQDSAGKKIGHITMWTGSAWISDTIQLAGESPPGNALNSHGYDFRYWRP